jgi:hypothetical protein
VTGSAESGWAWWRERRLPAEVLHLDSAAAGRTWLAGPRGVGVLGVTNPGGTVCASPPPT